MSDTRLPLGFCPGCQNKLDAATEAGPGDATAKPGDLSVCFYCGLILKFDDSMRPVRLSQQEYLGLSGELRNHVEIASSAVKQYRAASN